MNRTINGLGRIKGEFAGFGFGDFSGISGGATVLLSP